MKKFLIAVLVGGALTVSSGASARHFIGVTFNGANAQQDCEAFLREAKKEGRHARREFGTEEGTAGSYNRDFNLYCKDNGDGTFTTAGS